MSTCVNVIGPPFFTCSLKVGTTDPLEPNTLPNRTIEKIVPDLESLADWPKTDGATSAYACNTISAKRLVAPIMLDGRTALSVLISTKFRTL